MTTSSLIDVPAEAAAITAALEARRDPDYEWGMRRTVPSSQPAHSVRVPQIYKTAAEWRRGHKGAAPEETLTLCEALWRTGWREERLVAIELVRRDRKVMAAAGWQRLEDWSAGIDNWEQVDSLAGVTGRLLIGDETLLRRVHALETSENPWQRRLALVTLIVAFMKAGVMREELRAMSDRLQKDKHPLVRRAVVWARDRLKKDHIDD